MRRLEMRDADGDVIVVDVDDLTRIGYGAFGAIFPVPGDSSYVAKRIELQPPEPVGNKGRHIAHINITRSRLLAIKAEEEARWDPRDYIIDAIDQIVEQALSTHWCFETTGLDITAVWFLQKRAPGTRLLDLFRELQSPPIWTREAIAADVVKRMRTLRRADLVHLDCVPDNIIVDLATQTATLIDLDGCGIVRRTASVSDDWDHPPVTFGHTDTVRPPAWYPQPDVEVGPKAGNYLFAERWTVIDTLIRILTWDHIPGALVWLDERPRRALRTAYRQVGELLDERRSRGEACDANTWRALYTQALRELRTFDPLPLYAPNGAFPSSLAGFARLSQRACFDSRALEVLNTSPYEEYRQRIMRTRW